jgi:hypothetical protein
MTDPSVALDRDALYYPYIHVRDVDWLKATLLCFPRVHRMVPKDFQLEDPKAISEFRDVEGPRGPLLAEVDPYEYGVYRAHERLYDKIREHDVELYERYRRENALQEFGAQIDDFQIHKAKSPALINYLKEIDLAWNSDDDDESPWVCMHPSLLDAIMSTVAIAHSKEAGFDIVTDNSDIHHTVLAAHEDEVFDVLLGRPRQSRLPAATETADQLAEVVMTTAFDVRKLSARQIADLLKDGKDLRRFKDRLMPIAARMPEIQDSALRKKRLEEMSKEVVSEWQKYRKSLPRFAADAILDASNLKFPDIMGSIIAAGASGYLVHAGLGIGIGLLAYSGLQVYRKFQDAQDSPFKYLSRIEKAGATLVLPHGGATGAA